eukprot:1040061-Rhodomonas_salina.5
MCCVGTALRLSHTLCKHTASVPLSSIPHSPYYFHSSALQPYDTSRAYVCWYQDTRRRIGLAASTNLSAIWSEAHRRPGSSTAEVSTGHRIGRYDSNA